MTLDDSGERNADLSPASPLEPKRPLLITILCALGALYVFLIFYIFIMLDRERSLLIHIYGWEFFTFLVISHLLILISLIAIWKMRYCGMFLFAATIIFSAIYSYAVKIPTARWEYVPGLIIILACFFYRKQMR